MAYPRCPQGYEALARDGYMLLAERLREEGEKEVVRRTLQRHLRVQLDVGALYTVSPTVTERNWIVTGPGSA